MMDIDAGAEVPAPSWPTCMHQADFTGVLPLLNPARRAWLAAALARVHPGHPWISELQGRA